MKNNIYLVLLAVTMLCFASCKTDNAKGDTSRQVKSILNTHKQVSSGTSSGSGSSQVDISTVGSPNGGGSPAASASSSTATTTSTPTVVTNDIGIGERINLRSTVSNGKLTFTINNFSTVVTIFSGTINDAVSNNTTSQRLQCTVEGQKLIVFAAKKDLLSKKGPVYIRLYLENDPSSNTWTGNSTDDVSLIVQKENNQKIRFVEKK